jgi:hypothetical protein
MGMKRQSIWDRKILRRIYGLEVEQGMWRIRTNEELRVLYNYLDIVANIKKNGLEWIREGQLRKYLGVNWREVEEEEDID